MDWVLLKECVVASVYLLLSVGIWLVGAVYLVRTVIHKLFFND